MYRRPPGSTRNDPLLPVAPLFLGRRAGAAPVARGADGGRRPGGSEAARHGDGLFLARPGYVAAARPGCADGTGALHDGGEVGQSRHDRRIAAAIRLSAPPESDDLGISAVSVAYEADHYPR